MIVGEREGTGRRGCGLGGGASSQRGTETCRNILSINLQFLKVAITYCACFVNVSCKSIVTTYMVGTLQSFSFLRELEHQIYSQFTLH